MIIQKRHERAKRAAAAEELNKATKVRRLIASYRKGDTSWAAVRAEIGYQWPEQKQVRVITKSMRSQAPRHRETVDIR